MRACRRVRVPLRAWGFSRGPSGQTRSSSCGSAWRRPRGLVGTTAKNQRKVLPAKVVAAKTPPCAGSRGKRMSRASVSPPVPRPPAAPLAHLAPPCSRAPSAHGPRAPAGEPQQRVVSAHDRASCTDGVPGIWDLGVGGEGGTRSWNAVSDAALRRRYWRFMMGASAHPQGDVETGVRAEARGSAQAESRDR